MPTSSGNRSCSRPVRMRWFAARHRCVAFAALGLVACAGEGPVAPPAKAECDGVAQDVLSLEPFEGRVVSGAAVHCLVLAGGGASYLVMPQLTGASLPYGGYGYRLGDPDATPPVALRELHGMDVRAAEASAVDAQSSLDAILRGRESVVTPPGQIAPARLRSRDEARADAVDPEPLRRFNVLSTLEATPTWAAVDARLRFMGARVAIYLDTLAESSLTDAELTAMGTLYDTHLAPRVLTAFGDGTDIDDNGRVLFVLTPTVNAMVTAAECPTRGFVRGFFHSHDLTSFAPTSNQGEVFYGFVPDPAARWSCAHSRAEVLSNLPPTFMHELQHMISFGAHAITRGGAGEEPWLNEGLSHVAEELGSLYWEGVFPAPTGRTAPTQIFPDSASAYINPNLLYSYRYLFSSPFFSLTTCAPGSFCSLNERGGIWLLLRWLADQEGPAVLRSLVQTALTGRANLEAVSGATTAALLGDFAIAVSTDSIEGIARDRVPSRYRFASRNLRSIYRKLHEVFGIQGGISRPYPIAPGALDPGSAITGTMRPGTFAAYRLRLDPGTPTARLRFAVPDGSAFPASSGAQLAIFRLP